MLRLIASVVYVFFFFILGIPVLVVEWIYRKINPQRSDLHQLQIVQWAFRCVLFFSGVKLEVRGKENIPKDKAVLYVGNHRSIFDILVTYINCPGVTGYISKDSVKKVPILGIWMQRLHCIFIDRNDIKQSMKVILHAIEEVKGGVSICIFPEGTRNKDQEDPKSLLPFKDGSFKIAQKSGCPIVPMAITGTADILENHFPKIKSGKVIVTYGKPISLEELDKDIARHPGNYFREIVSEMLKEQ